MSFVSNCAKGQFNPGLGVLNCTGCSKQLPADVLTTSCTAVPSGQYSSCCGAITPSFTIDICSPVSPLQVDVCSLCPPGQFSETGSTPCSYCTVAGRFSYTGGRLCDLCPPGRFNSGAVGICNGCPMGTYSAATGATSSSTCIVCSSSPVQLVSVQGSSSCSLGCPAGYYKDASNTCISCSAGFYQPNSDQILCTPCHAGTYLSATGQVSQKNCTSCPQGYYSVPGASSCTLCSAGNYSSSPAVNPTCTSCPVGTSSTVGSVASIACQDCSAGNYSPGPGTTCIGCAIGLYLPTAGSIESSKCLPCPQGTSSSIIGAQSLASCVSCSSGFYSATVGSTSCSSCPAGQAQDASGQPNCVACSISQFAYTQGSYSCQECPIGRTSTQASSNCPLAAAGRYLSTAAALTATTAALPCPPAAFCRGGTETPRPIKGAWSSHKNLELSTLLYNCTRKTCFGATDSPYDSCWEHATFASMACQDARLTCSEGAFGPLCGSCFPGFTYSAVELVCTACGNAGVQEYITLGVLSGLGLSIAALYRWWIWFPLWARESWIAGTLQQLDGGKCKIAWSTLQIIGSVSVSLNVEWPPVFQDFLNSLSVLSFSFLSPDCAGGSPSFYRTVVVWSVAPVIASGLIGLSLAAHLAQAFATTSTEVDRTSTVELLCRTHLTYLIALTYLVLPAVLLKQ